MRAFAAAWPDTASVQQLVAHLPWGRNLQLLGKLEDPELRRWYATEAIANGWSIAERELEAALVSHVQAFLLELGHGFAFVGTQYRLASMMSPVAVAGYRYTELGAEERAILPAEDELTQVVAEVMDEFDWPPADD